jgi:hypothetical protein
MQRDAICVIQTYRESTLNDSVTKMILEKFLINRILKSCSVNKKFNNFVDSNKIMLIRGSNNISSYSTNY